VKASAVQEVRISDKVKRERVDNVTEVFRTVGMFAGMINQIWQGSLSKRTAEIDEESERRKEAVENSIMSEEEKAEAIATIDQEADAKKRKLQKENAIREKISTLFGIALNTALAVVKALPNIPLSIAVGALGLTQLGIAAATPIPLAEGGLIRSDPGRGVIAQVGEGKQDEIVLPMKTGAAELANNIFGKMKSFGSDIVQRVAPRPVENHYHVGTLIANEFGVKEFAKRVNKYQIAEHQRTGYSNA